MGISLALVLLIAAVQGATELFPVSSLGHAVLLPPIFHLGFDQSDPQFVPFLTLLHLGTAGALLCLYWKTWLEIIRGFFRAAIRGRITDSNERLAMMLLVGTMPAALVGVILEGPLKHLFTSTTPAAIFLMTNGVILAGAELLRRRDERRRSPLSTTAREREEHFASIDGLSFGRALFIGTTQVLALFPGISRSGVTMAGGLLSGLRHQEALRFSFLLATPIIGAAGVLEVPQLLESGAPLGRYLLGAVLAGVVAYASARFLVRYFAVGRLDPFALYCVALGVTGLVVTR